MALIGAIGVYSRGARFAWRGLSSADYSLTSSLTRKLPRANEDTIADDERATLLRAREWGLGFVGGRGVSDLQLLTELQHFGIATRLVDFTSNPMTALWFACQTPSTKSAAKSGLLLALNTSTLDATETQENNAGVTWNNMSGDSLQRFAVGNKPTVIQASIPNDRLRAQEGYFVAGPTPPPGLALEFSQTPFRSFALSFSPNEEPPDDFKTRLLAAARSPGKPRTIPFVAIVVPSKVKQRLLDILASTYNRSAKTLFPDYEGLRSYGGVRPFRGSTT